MRSQKFKKFRFSEPYITLASLVALFVVLALGRNILYTYSQKAPKHRVVAQVNAKTDVQESSPSATPTLSPTATPSPTAPLLPTNPPDSFCIYAPVILYHHIEPYGQAKQEGHAQLTVDPSLFEAQMKYISEHGYRTISAEELVNAVVGHQQLGKVIVVTIDDAYSDAYTYAYPIARKYGITLNLAVPSGLLGNPGYMSWGNLKDMVGSGTVTAYDHTWSHYNLAAGDEAKIQLEIMTAKTQLEQQLGKSQRVFFYPYGGFNGHVIDALKKDGFVGAFTTISSSQQCDGYIMALHRIHIGNAPLSSYGL